MNFSFPISVNVNDLETRDADGGADRSLSSLLLMLSVLSIDASQYGTGIKFPSDSVCVYFFSPQRCLLLTRPIKKKRERRKNDIKTE